MGDAIAVAVTLGWGAALAWVVVSAQRIGVLKDPSGSLSVAVAGLFVACASLTVMALAPVVHGAGSYWWPGVVTDYFLAMGNRLVGGPFAFFWTPRWVYLVGSLTPLVALGASIALAGGVLALPSSRRAAPVVVAVASCQLIAFTAAGACTAAAVWNGIPV